MLKRSSADLLRITAPLSITEHVAAAAEDFRLRRSPTGVLLGSNKLAKGVTRRRYRPGGAPKGNQNAFKHGFYTEQATIERQINPPDQPRPRR